MLPCRAPKQGDAGAALGMLGVQSCNPRRVNLLPLSCLQEGELNELSLECGNFPLDLRAKERIGGTFMRLYLGPYLLLSIVKKRLLQERGQGTHL